MSLEKIISRLEPLAFHNVPLNTLKELVNPLSCWSELKSPITEKEVLDCLKAGKEELVDTPLALEMVFSGKHLDLDKMRENHIKKIAYFVKNESTEPIVIDVGYPSMGTLSSYLIDDGNHRLAGAFIRKDNHIKSRLVGEVEHMKTLGLWSPNEAYLELEALYEEQYQERRKNKNKM